jgi:RNA polymerase sigma factor (sigma-70 family)
VPLDIFFTFPVLDADDQRKVLVRWSANARLQRHIEDLVRQNPKFNEATLARVFMEAIRQSPPSSIAKNHLVAFLASFSYRSAARIKDELEQLNHLPSDTYAFLQDLFQSAFEIALHPVEFFKNFDVERSQDVFWYFSLKGYTRRKLEGLLRDKVRSIEGLTTYGRTDLGLAARSSEKRVIVALRIMGEPESKIAQFVLAWKCFQEARNAKILQVDSPQPQQFEAITHRYNHLKSKQPAPAIPDLDGPTIEQWLKTIGAAIRRYCDRPVESLDVSVYKESGDATWGELMADEFTVSEANTLSSAEIQTDLRDLKQLLDNAIQTLDLELKRIFILKYGLTLTQTQIGAELKKHQSSISRTHRNFEENLLKQLAKTFSTHSAPGIDPDTLLALRDDLNEYWQTYYAEMMHHLFQASSHALNPQFRNSLRLAYCKLTASSDSQTQDSETQLILQAKRFFLDSAILRIQNYGQFVLEPQSGAWQKITEMTEQWLQTSSPNF